MAIAFHEIGRCLIKMNRLNDAKDYLEKALKIKQISKDIDFDKDIAFTLSEIDQYLIKTNRYTDAKAYLRKACRINQQM